MLNRSCLSNAVYLFPALLIYSVFLLFPLMASLAIAFTDWDGSARPLFIGLGNFIQIFKDAQFWTAVGNNVLLMVF